jgi:hypothetical protein
MYVLTKTHKDTKMLYIFTSKELLLEAVINESSSHKINTAYFVFSRCEGSGMCKVVKDRTGVLTNCTNISLENALKIADVLIEQARF